MQEFSSVTASSYDAESLAPMLTEKAADGWSVVSIVSAGTNVVAYLTRGGEAAPATDASAAIDAGIAEIEVNQEADAAIADEVTAISPTLPGDDAPEAPAAVTSSPEAVAAVEASGEPSGWGAVADSPSVPDTPSVPTLPDSSDAGLGAVAGGIGATANAASVGGATLADDEPSAIEPSGHSSATDDADVATPQYGDAVQGAAEHAGAVGTEAIDGASDTGAGLADSIGDATSGAAQTIDTGVADDTTTFDDTATADTTDDTTAADTSAAEDAGAASGVPAGWYADPSGRFELRYWDGNAWTEHVSRAGQQYTDPPVA